MVVWRHWALFKVQKFILVLHNVSMVEPSQLLRFVLNVFKLSYVLHFKLLQNERARLMVLCKWRIARDFFVDQIYGSKSAFTYTLIQYEFLFA